MSGQHPHHSHQHSHLDVMNLALQLCPPLVGVPQLLLQSKVGILLRTRCSRPHLGVYGDHQTGGDDGNGDGNGDL